MFVWQRFPDDGARGKAKATRAQPRRSGRSTLEAFGPTVRNRRNAALSLALLVAHWADASLILPLAELGSAPTLLCSRKAESSIVGNTLSAESDARPQAKGRKGGERYDVFHYHLHVVYIPVIEKEILWSKRCKDEALRGTVREIIHQVSRSKKWAYPEAVDEQGKPILGKNGKPIRIPSYSLLQDRFYEHMRLAGFDGFERGELGSTRVNLNSLDFKIQEDKKRLMQLEKLVAAKEMKLEQVSEKLVAQKQVNKQYHDLDGIGKTTVFGKIELTEKDYTDVISLAREGILSRVKISELTQKLQDAGARILDLQSSWERLYEQTKDFRQAVKLAPQRVKEVFAEIFAKDRETRELQRTLRRSVKKRDERER